MVAGAECMCGRVVAPPRLLCPDCQGHMNIVELASDGALLSFTQLHVPPEGFDPGLIIGLVELERGAKMLCEAEEGIALAALHIGMQVAVRRDEDRYRFAIV